jgi:hypothetical protein
MRKPRQPKTLKNKLLRAAAAASYGDDDAEDGSLELVITIESELTTSSGMKEMKDHNLKFGGRMYKVPDHEEVEYFHGSAQRGNKK